MCLFIWYMYVVDTLHEWSESSMSLLLISIKSSPVCWVIYFSEDISLNNVSDI